MALDLSFKFEFHPNIQNIWDCQKKCKRATHCQYFTFNDATKTCTLKTDAAIHNKKYRRGTNFAHRDCIITERGKSYLSTGNYNTHTHTKF